MRDRPAKTPAATYFFTVVTCDRQPPFHSDETLTPLRKAFHIVKTEENWC